MTTTKPRLGKGLDALISTGILADPTLALEPTRVPIQRIELNPHQPRKHFDPEELEKLTESVRQHGLLQPLLVRKQGDRWQLIAGERRFRACQAVGMTEVPVYVRELNDQQLFEAALVENVQRSDLNPIEKARGFKDYLDRFQLSHEQLAEKIGVERSTISNLIGLLNLVPEVQDMVKQGALTLGHAKVLKGISDKERQVLLAKEVVQGGLSVHALEQLTRIQRSDKPEPGAAKLAVEKTTHVQSIEDELRQKLAMRVAIKLRSKEKGQIVLTFDSNDDFERLLEVLRK